MTSFLLKHIRLREIIVIYNVKSSKRLKRYLRTNTMGDKTGTTACAASMSDQKLYMCKRLTVDIQEDKNNQVYFCGNPTKSKENVVYFGGDVQDFTENMKGHRDNRHYVQWSIEKTGDLLSSLFPGTNVWIVRPSTMHLGTFSVYSNFVESSRFGNPTHSSGHGGLKYLSELLQKAVELLTNERDCNKTDECDCDHKQTDLSESTDCQNSDDAVSIKQRDQAVVRSTMCINEGHYDNRTLLNVPMRIIGFSKGCVVLNQFLYEMNEVKSDETMSGFVKRITDMYWLDGGHSGGSNTWISDTQILSGLVDTGIHIHVHTTPYQVWDTSRPWIGKEKKKFIEKLRRSKVKVTDCLHFEEEERTLDNHFKVLHVFK